MNKNIKPPKLADKIFLWFCNRANSEDLHGDVEELFHADVQAHGVFKARIIYWRRIFSLMFSYAVKLRKQQASYSEFSSSNIGMVMFKNYLKTASRSLARNKFFTVLNVFGLALGLSISLLFVAMVSFILGYDNFHTKGEKIYRVTTFISDNNENPHYASAPAGLVQKLTEEFAGAEIVVPIQQSLQGDAMYVEKKIFLDGAFTTPDFWNVFDFPLVKGSPLTALSNPNSIVITEREAAKIFGDKEPMGEIIKMEPYGDFVVTGILKDFPKNSHMRFEALASYTTWATQQDKSFIAEESWDNFMNSYVYFIMPPKATTAAAEFLDRTAAEQYIPGKTSVEFRLQALADIVPGPSMLNAIGNTWDYLTLTLIGGITFIILIPACSNYVSLAISQSLNRMREIGVRKVMGGQKSQIFFQFIMETTLTMLLALVLSYFIFEMIRGEYLTNYGNTDSMDLTPTVLMVVNFILFALLVGFIAGIIPAMYFARLAPVKALKGKTEGMVNRNRFSIRNMIMTVQFILSLGFIMSVVIVNRQYQYSVNYDVGFEQQNILDVELLDVDPQQFRTEFGKLASIHNVSMSSHLLGMGGSFTRYVMSDDRTDSLKVHSISADENFIGNMKLSLLAGNNFSDQPSQNTNTILVNEEFIKIHNLGDAPSAINKLVVLSDDREVRIGGVLKNFHYAGLWSLVGPFFIEYNPAQFHYANLTLTGGSNFEDIVAMESSWKKLGSNEKFKANFLSDEIQEAYSFYYEMMKLWGYLGLMAITVACLGLLGTVVFTIRNRLREVSIRKVMGASSGSLIYLLSKDFVILLIVAGVITVPAVYFMFQDWLLPSVQYYSVQIGFLEASTSLLIMLVLGMATILSQTLKAANTNPVDNLRSE